MQRRSQPKRSPPPDPETFFYGLLVLALLAFIGWRWWVYHHAPQHSAAAARPKPTNTFVIAPPSLTEARPVATVFEEQIALAREGISSGSIDGVAGNQTRAALMAFQRKHNLPITGSLDPDTRAQLLISPPLTNDYTITDDNLSHVSPPPKSWLEKSQQTRLDYESIVALLAEKSFSHPQLIRSLNPDVAWTNIIAGTHVTIPNVSYPAVTRKAAAINISLHDCVLEAFDSDSNLLVHFPCSIGRVAEKRPVGELHVENIAINPNYTFDPALYPESPEAQDSEDKLIIPPGPRNPVGVAWIGLDRPGFGMHGTPVPENVGRTESHGCFRLANWNAEYLAHLVWIGLPVTVQP